MANLKSRVDKLAHRMGRNKPVVLFYLEDDETLDQAKARYTQEHGAELPDHAMIVRITTA